MFSKKNYNWKDLLLIPLKVAPFLVISYLFLEVIQVIVSTIILVYATSNLVDNIYILAEQNNYNIKLILALLWLLLTIFSLKLISLISDLLIIRIKLKLQERVEYELLEQRALLKYKYIENSETMDLIERLSEGLVINLYSGFKAIVSTIKNILSLYSMLILLSLYTLWSVIVIVLISIPLFIFSFKSGNKNYNSWKNAMIYERKYSYYSDDILTSAGASRERTIFNYSKYILGFYIKYFERARKIQEKVARQIKITKELVLILMTFIVFLISCTLISPFIKGEFSSGLFIGIITSLFTITSTIGNNMQSSAKDLSYALSSIKDLNVFNKLDIEYEALDMPDKEILEFRHLCFKNVSFKYPNSKNYILRNLSFNIETNKHYAFVGKNGSGKTTIIKLLTRLYDDYEGEIFINDRELRTYKLSTIKSIFSVVYQDFSKYNITLEDNILIGNISKDINIEKLNIVINKIGLENLINSLKLGLKTNVGKIFSNSIDFSEGQWQKIAIARSMVSTAPIKIMDEPTASLDPITESNVYRKFEEIMKDKTTIFISHRLGSTKLADEIFVFENGEIIEKGNHESLIKLNGVYKEMFEVQKKWYDL